MGAKLAFRVKKVLGVRSLWSYRWQLSCALVLLGSLMFAGSTSAQATTDSAAILTITYEGVGIQRVGTQAWLSLPKGAIAPVGTGDILKTNELGRAYLLFNGYEVLLLPNSQLEIVLYRSDELHLRVRGRSVHFAPPIAGFSLETINTTLSDLPGHFALQSEPDRDYWVVGAGELHLDGETLKRGEGARVTSAGVEAVDFPQGAVSFARIEGALDGCLGHVKTVQGVELRARGGPKTTFFFITAFDNGDPVQLMGYADTNNGRWYRVQVLSQFGWVLGAAIETTCTGLPDLGINQIEPHYQ